MVQLQLMLIGILPNNESNKKYFIYRKEGRIEKAKAIKGLFFDTNRIARSSLSPKCNLQFPSGKNTDNDSGAFFMIPLK